VFATRAHALSSILSFLRRRGFDADGLATRHGVGAAEAPEPAALSAFAEEAAAVTGVFDLGVQAALESEPVRGEAAAEPMALAAALERWCAATAALDPRVRFTVEITETGAVLALRVPASGRGLGRHASELLLVSALAWVRAVTGCTIVPQRAWLGHVAPADSTALAAALGGAPLSFRAPDSGFILEPEALAAPVVVPELVPVPAGRDLVGDMRALLRPTLREGVAPVGALARALGMSTRTLQRRLLGLGTTYAEVLDDLRRDHARLHLERRGVSVAAAARQTGYSDSRAFIRAFRRWTGGTPGTYRTADAAL
jgi:AraC-like DNA-binding protein